MYNINNMPESSLSKPNAAGDEAFIPKGRSVPFINGPKWIDQSFKLISKQPKTWLMVLAVFIVLELLLNSIPENLLLAGASSWFLLPPLIANILETLLFAGIIAIAESQRLTGQAEFGLLNTGFVNRTGGIIGSIIIQLLIIVAGVLSAAIFIGFSAMPYLGQIVYAAETGSEELMTSALLAIGVGKLITAALIVLIAVVISQMLTCFAVPLMINKQFSLGSALSTSFSACLKNILPGIAYMISLVIVLIIFSFIADFIPVFDNLIWLFGAILKVIFWYLAVYSAYRNIFYYSEVLVR